MHAYFTRPWLMNAELHSHSGLAPVTSQHVGLVTDSAESVVLGEDVTSYRFEGQWHTSRETSCSDHGSSEPAS